ncbi:MAG: hypothetical protein AUG49_13275 [Catenulispora sp. 13_1_20CM_3_70_7]|nr:MAG: hypothetical protein AUG49_13275 [Catenulispora sp. 13_1_20CM_3_70_7]
MRILFSSVVAFLTDAGMAGYLGERTLLPAGPDTVALLAEVERRTGGGDARHPGAAAVELFAGARIDSTFDEALAQARKFGPDVVVCEAVDFVGPMVAAALDVPWASHAISAPLPEPLYGMMVERGAVQHASRGLRPRNRFALVDPAPDALRSPDDPARPEDLIVLRPTAHRGSGGSEPQLPAGKPLVLVTVGTSVQEPELVADLVGSVTRAGYEVVVTTEPGTLPPNPLAHEIGFVPLARLLPSVDAVVGAAGSGTVMATLASGLPAVLRPVLADQPWNAQRVVAAGAGIAIEDPAEAGPAVRTVLTEPAYRAAARAAADSIRSMPSPEEALTELLARADASGQL